MEIKYEELLKEVSNHVQLPDEFKKIKYYQVILCYFLWKMQKDPTLVTPEDMESRGYNGKMFQYAVMIFDDLFGYFADEREKWQHLRDLIGKYSDEELTECLKNVDYFDGKGPETIPDGITNLVSEFLEIEPQDTILQLNTKCGEFACTVGGKYSDISINAYDEDYNYLHAASIMADIYEISNITFSSDLGDEQEYYKKVFSNSTINPLEQLIRCDLSFNLRSCWKEFPTDIATPQWISCAYAINRTEVGGKTVSLMNAGQLTVKNTREVRKFLCDGGYIEGVIILPEKMYSDTWVSPFLVIFGKNNQTIKFYDARKKCIGGRNRGKRTNLLTEANIQEIVREYKNNISVSVVSLENIRDNDYNLNPLRYLEKTDEFKRTVDLGSLVKDIKRGITLSAADMDALITEEESDYKCVIPASIRDGVVSTKLYYQGEVKKKGKNEAKYNNILLSKVGNPFHVALAKRTYLVVGNVYILEVDSSKINPAYLKCFLSSKQGQEALGQFAVSSTTPVIGMGNIEKVQIPIYDEKEQAEISSRCEAILEELEVCYQQICDREQEINDIFG